MEFNFENLNEQTRLAMVSEVKTDIDRETIYYSKRFTKYGRIKYLALLLDAVKSGNEQTLAKSIKFNYSFVETEKREGKSGVIQANIPKNANQIFAESEFNRFYIRALAKIAISTNRELLILLICFMICEIISALIPHLDYQWDPIVDFQFG